MWNGTAEILNASPTSTNTMPTIRPGEAVAGCDSVFARAAKSIVPEKP
jgi:hypothetical protein